MLKWSNRLQKNTNGSNEKEELSKSSNQNVTELQKLKAILRAKMKEYDDLLDETTKRDTEYQRLLQENDNRLFELSQQNVNLTNEIVSFILIFRRQYSKINRRLLMMLLKN